MAVTLRNTEHVGNTAFIFCFEIENLGEDYDVDGQTFDVQGLAQMKLLVRHTTDSKVQIRLSVIKHQLTMVLKTEMNVICEDQEFKCDFDCCEKWSPYSTIFKTDQTEDIQFNLEVYIKVSSCKSVLDIMYVDEDFTDFHLSATDGSVAVHRACLASHSDVFRRMLCGEWKEAAEGRVQIEGVTLETLQHLKQCIYLGTLPASGLEPLLMIATYYLIDELKAECIIKLAYSVSSKNLYDLLEFSFTNNVPELSFAILKTLRAQPSNVIESAHKRMIKPVRNNQDIIENKEAVSEELAIAVDQPK